MPLTFLKPGEKSLISHISGNAETRQHLIDLGFVIGSEVTVISELAGNMIVHIKDSRIAISKEMAAKIHV